MPDLQSNTTYKQLTVVIVVLVVVMIISTVILSDYNNIDPLIGGADDIDDNSENENNSLGNRMDMETAEVKLISNGKVVDTVTAEKSTTITEIYTGLSNKETLESGEGMIFIYDNTSDRTFVMREMDFGLDIVFIGDDCSVNSIKHAEKPKPGETGEEVFNQYNGTARYVLELPYNYTENRISEEDSISFNDC